jgi:hypothetical protein
MGRTFARLWGCLILAGSIAVGCSTSKSGAPDNGNGSTATSAIGPSGGTVQAGGAMLEVPAGALATDANITITETSDAPPAGVTALSPIYRFAPDGLVFAKPVSVTISFTGGAAAPAMFWTMQGGSTFDNIGGNAVADAVTANVTHFSSGFVGAASSSSAGDAGGGADASSGRDAGSSTDGSTSSDGSSSGCAAGEAFCGGGCVSTTSNAQHCGSCNNTCASGLCSFGSCACKPQATPCGGGPECCSGVCANAVCGAPESGTCSPLGQPCTGPTTCCSGICLSNNCSNGTCTATGQPCTTPTACCTGICDGTNHCNLPTL